MINYIKSRREFIRKIAYTSMGFSAMPSSLFSLQTWAAAASQNTIDCQDYKALVCFYMLGGNDGFNTLIPKGANEYSEYATARGNLAIPQNEILEIDPIINLSGKAWAFILI